jgi:dTDP-4-dehydrorhamnose reductase
MRILITGAAGRLGSLLVERAAAAGHDVTGVDVTELDVTDFEATRAFIREQRPQLIVHPAAWTDVDGCARDPEQAVIVNGYGAQHVALAAAAIDAGMVYISSNEVFDGLSGTPYREYDTPRPANPYGYSKWVGEQAVLQYAPRPTVVRIAWLFAHGGKSFPQAILSAADSGTPLRVVTDEIANPTYSEDLADALMTLISTRRYGIYHLTNQGSCSRHELARYVLDRAGCARVPIAPVTLNEWQRASTPPPYTPLVNSAGALTGIRLRPWQEAVEAWLRREGRLAG